MRPCRFRIPGLTPGRTMVWGSILAVAGTAALVAASARGLGAKPTSRTAAAQPAPDA